MKKSKSIFIHLWLTMSEVFASIILVANLHSSQHSLSFKIDPSVYWDRVSLSPGKIDNYFINPIEKMCYISHYTKNIKPYTHTKDSTE